MSIVPPGLFTIRGVMGVCHLLVDAAGDVVLIDTGLVGEPALIRWRLRRLGLGLGNVKAVLLTHGHLDHAGNLAWVKHATGATIYAHAAEQLHIDGVYPYTGINAWCGKLERAGRALFGVGAPVKIDVLIEDGDLLPYWDGLRVVHLPGHTVGHCGFYSAKHDLLFSGDLFASYGWNVHVPPPILNSAPALIASSLTKAVALDPRGMVPQHYDVLNPGLHRRRFDQLLAKQAWRASRRKPAVV